MIKAYAVNALDFNLIHGSVMTAGGDGTVATWDPFSKNKLTTLTIPNSNKVTSAKISNDGNTIAIATGYDYSEGYKTNSINELFIYDLKDNEKMCKKK